MRRLTDNKSGGRRLVRPQVMLDRHSLATDVEDLEDVVPEQEEAVTVGSSRVRVPQNHDFVQQVLLRRTFAFTRYLVHFLG